MHRAVAKMPNTRKGCDDAWYLTSFSMGSGSKSVAWKYICGKIRPSRIVAYTGSPKLYK